MKQLLFFVVLIVASCTNNKKDKPPVYFIGEVQYNYTYSSNNLNYDSLIESKPTSSIFRFDTANYQSQFIGKDTTTYYYSSHLNKAVSKTNNKMENGCDDYSLPTDSIHSYRIYDTDEKILGYPCRILEFKSNVFNTKYYVSKDLILSPLTYKKHKAYNWSFYGEQANGGLILRLEHQFKNYSMTGNAVIIKEYALSFKALEIAKKDFNKICESN